MKILKLFKKKKILREKQLRFNLRVKFSRRAHNNWDRKEYLNVHEMINKTISTNHMNSRKNECKVYAGITFQFQTQILKLLKAFWQRGKNIYCYLIVITS